jgi:hypothetical protein
MPLVIVSVVVAYVISARLTPKPAAAGDPGPATPGHPEPEPAGHTAPPGAHVPGDD